MGPQLTLMFMGHSGMPRCSWLRVCCTSGWSFISLVEMLVQLQLLQTGGSPALPHLERAHAPPAAAPAGVKSLILTSGEAAGPGASRAPSQQEPPPLPPRLFLDQDAESV